MDNALKAQVIQVMNTYTGDALNGKSYLLQDSEGCRFTVVDSPTWAKTCRRR